MADEDAPETDTSISFLEPLAPVVASMSSTGSATAEVALPDVIDPAFLEYTIAIPRCIEKLFKNVEAINFIYAIEDGEYILVKGAASKVFRILVGSYGAFAFPPDVSARLVFIVGKQRYRASMRSAQRREYLASAENGKQYEAADQLRVLKRRYLEYQVDTGLNIIHIEDSADLHREIKTVVTLLDRQHRYTPKVKCYGDGQREEYFKGVLRTIPGISESVATAIYERFPSFKELRSALLRDREAVVGLVIYDPSRQNSRTLGEKCCARLVSSLISEERNKKI